MTADVPLLEARGVEKSYGSHKVLAGVDMRVDRGQVLAILGPSGSGKTTFLRCINHLETIDRGTISVDGHLVGFRRSGNTLYELHPREIARQRTDIGMVFQSFNLFGHLTALENIIEAPIGVLRKSRKEAVRRAEELLERVGLSDKAQAYPARLSGGQQQRVAIARALAMDPKLMLFDEPTSALDPELVGEVLDVMRDLAEKGTTMIVVTHEVQFARDVCDTVVIMADGTVVEAGSPEKVLVSPSHPRAQAFLSAVH